MVGSANIGEGEHEHEHEAKIKSRSFIYSKIEGRNFIPLALTQIFALYPPPLHQSRYRSSSLKIKINFKLLKDFIIGESSDM